MTDDGRMDDQGLRSAPGMRNTSLTGALRPLYLAEGGGEKEYIYYDIGRFQRERCHRERDVTERAMLQRERSQGVEIQKPSLSTHIQQDTRAVSGRSHTLRTCSTVTPLNTSFWAFSAARRREDKRLRGVIHHPSSIIHHSSFIIHH